VIDEWESYVCARVTPITFYERMPVRKYVLIDVFDFCYLFNQTFYGLLFSDLTITHLTSYVHHKFPVSFATITTCLINQSSLQGAP